MAFKKLDMSDLSKILDYTRFLKTPDDPSIKMYQGQDGTFVNTTRIEDEKSEISKNYNNQLIESKEDVKRDC
jgi:hypothetical protein